MINKEFLKLLDEVAHDARCELNYSKDYELLIAVMLSAQTTDKKVNQVTYVLFNLYKNLDDLFNSSLIDLEKILFPLGNYHKKAIYIKEIVKELITKYDYKVPKEKEKLIKLAGVGNKTSNVFLAEYYNIPSFPVDTHVYRVSYRLGFRNEKDNVLETEKKLMKIFDEKDFIKLHHQFIYFGRYICKAIKPNCCQCPFKKYCVLN